MYIFYANDICFTRYKSCFMSVLLALRISIAGLLRHITAQQWLVLFCGHLFVFFSLRPRQSIQGTFWHFYRWDFSFARQQQNAQHRHVLSAATGSSTRFWYHSVHTPPCGIPFTACMFMWSSHCQWAYGTVQCIHLHVVFRSLHACLCGVCAVHGITFTCGTGFVHDMSSCGTGFVHDTCRHAVLCTVHSMHVHVEFCTVSRGVWYSGTPL